MSDPRMGMIVSGRVTASDAGSKMQRVWTEGRAGEGTDAINHLEPHGFTSRPLPGAETVTLEIAGAADYHVAIIVADRRYRLTGLAEGDVAIYDHRGQSVRLTAAGVVVESGDIFLGSASASNRVVLWDDLKTWLNGHTHTYAVPDHTSATGPTTGPVAPITDAPAATKVWGE